MNAATGKRYALDRPIHLDDFVRVCGYATAEGAPDGYGCRHPENEDRLNGAVVGRCLACACPLAAELSGTEPADAALLRCVGLAPDSTGWLLPWR